MAVSNNYEIKVYILDGVAVQFAIPFDVNVDDYGHAINIVVNLGLDELEKDVDYTISGKTINYPGAVDHAGEKLTVFRRTPIEQPVDFVDNGNFTLEDIETGLDRSIMIEQETSANLDNTIKAQESAERAEQYKDIAIEKASDAEDWAVGTRSDGQTPAHSLESAKHYAESADTSASMATSMRNQSAASALESEGWAVGKQSGVDVPGTSPYYHNNSKYYSDYASSTVGAHSTALTYLDSYSANVDTVAGMASDISTVASNTADISAVATDISDISAVATDISDVSTVAAGMTNINLVAGDLTNVDTVAGDISDVSAVAGDLTNIDAVAGISSDISSVAGNSTNINTVASNVTDVGTVASNMSSVNAVASNSTNINAVATDISDVSTVAGDLTNIDTVAGIGGSVTTVASVSSGIPTVAANVSDISTVATNIAGILASEDYASLSRQYDEGKHLDGTDVTSGEEGYENNAKYWADVASHYAVGTLVKLVRWS